MTNTWRVMIMIATGFVAYADGQAGAAGRMVTVCLENSPNALLGPSRVRSTAIFAAIGVDLEWRTSSRCPTLALRITLKESTPPDVQPGALAYAMPYEGTHIVVFWDRIKQTAARDQAATLLGYVMAHEITHILEGLCRHSHSGLMKAHWIQPDFDDMRVGQLHFAPEDVELIYDGIDRRESRLVLRAELKEYHGQTQRAEVPR